MCLAINFVDIILYYYTYEYIVNVADVSKHISALRRNLIIIIFYSSLYSLSVYVCEIFLLPHRIELAITIANRVLYS